MRIYLDTSLFIDYLTARGGHIGSGLRSSSRRGREPAVLFADAEKLLNCVRDGRTHKACTSALTFYEAEEALFNQLSMPAAGMSHARLLLVSAARAIVMQIQATSLIYDIEICELNASTISSQLKEIGLAHRGIRAADSLHIVTAILSGTDILVSGDQGIIDVDCVFSNRNGGQLRCLDSDAALPLLLNP